MPSKLPKFYYWWALIAFLVAACESYILHPERSTLDLATIAIVSGLIVLTFFVTIDFIIRYTYRRIQHDQKQRAARIEARFAKKKAGVKIS